ncbi:hypothetical protein Bca101_019217 [Brassica carinata]
MKSEEQHQDQDPNHQNYQQGDPMKMIWRAMQELKLGADRPRWSIREEAQEDFKKDHKLCLVARGLNPYHQNAPGLKVSLPRIWQLVGKVEGQINDDETVDFYFDTEHHLLMVLENQPYTYRGWLVAIDLWSHRDSATFLKYIPFKVRILKLPDMYRRYSIVEDIGSKLGHVEEVTIVEPTMAREARVSVKVLFDVDNEITLTREVDIIKDKPPVELDFRYVGLQKFCTLCGSLKHEYEFCKAFSKMQQRQYELMDRGINPYISAQERKEAIGEYISSMEVGEASGTAIAMQMEPTQESQAVSQVGTMTQGEAPIRQATSQEALTAARVEQGTKRKTPEDQEDSATTSTKRLELEQPNYGSAVLLKPQDHP